MRRADADALLVPPRILRRVIKRDRGLAFVGWYVARRRSYAIARGPLRAIASGDELGLAPGAPWPESAILLLRPDPRDLAGRGPAGVLADYWRLLFHARVASAVRRRLDGEWSPEPGLRGRVERIGTTGFEEARHVLRQEGYLLPPRDNATVYAEFAATYLELRHFAPALLPHFFPAIEDARSIDELLAEDVDAAALLASTRPAGAPDPPLAAAPAAGRVEPLAPPDSPSRRRSARARRGLFRWLIRHAERAGARGNVVRAAIDRARAGLLVGSLLSLQARVGAREELDHLVLRLRAALGFDDDVADGWRRGLEPLLERAIHGFWTPEGRLLYDLQRVCLDHEREVFALDLIDWARSLGRRPIRRPLPHLRAVQVTNHLRGASRRLRAARLGADERTLLADLIHPALRRAEEAVRDRFRPLIAAVLDSHGIVARNLPETVARRKLIEELLDRVVRRGFLNLGDLRDACSRSNLKLPDLSGPAEFFRGDRLLRTDRDLGKALEGVYRPGEVYLRWLQRLSALAFATRPGRFLTLYAALPFGGAFVMLEGLDHLVGPVVHWLTGRHVHLMSEASVLVLGALAMGLINFVRFRRWFLHALGVFFRGLRSVLLDVPARLLRLHLIRRVFDSRAVRVAWRFLVKPALLAAAVAGIGRAAWRPRSEFATTVAVLYLPSVVLLSTRVGRDLEEIAADSAVRLGRELAHDVIPGLFRLILSTFDRILEAIDRTLYAVDEWLRFRTGQSRPLLAAKAVLGLGWFCVAYLVRIFVNLLIEPQVNPIKHFPVVTVSHKVILPLSKQLTLLLAAFLAPLGERVALFIAGATVLLLPGVFGFLVWELKENWRLYAANRPEGLPEVIVGDHGETMGRLLRPGIHSGTLPKTFAKLRKSERPAPGAADEKSAFRRLEALHHVEESLRRFIERDFIALLRESRTLGPASIALGEVHVATNNIRIELRSGLEEENDPGLWIEFDERHDALIAGVEGPGWLQRLSDEQCRVLSAALVGLFKMCGADWVRAVPTAHAVPATVAEDHNGPRNRRDPARAEDGPAATLLLPFADVPVTWRRWVEAWEREHAGAKHMARFLEGFAILPRPESARKRSVRSAKRQP